MHKLLCLAAAFMMAGTAHALAFDYARYQVADLDTLLAQSRPRSGADLYPALPFRLRVTLVSYAEGCRTEFVKRSMVIADIPKDQVDALAITRCIKVRSPKGTELRVFIQDEVAAFLPKEVPLGSSLTLYAIHLFTKADGPGLLVNEFSTNAGNGPADQRAEGTLPSCGCGSPDLHPGIDSSHDLADARIAIRRSIRAALIAAYSA